MSVLVSTVLAYSNTLIQGNGTISNANGLLFFNDANKDYHLELIKRGVEASQIQEAYRDVAVPASGQGSTFLYPSDMVFLKNISVNMINTPTAGANAQNYITAQQIDIGNTQQNTSFEFLRLNQPVQQPIFDDRGDWFEIFPTFKASMNLIQALRIFYYLQPNLYTSVNDVLEYPESQDYYILADKIVALFYDSQEDQLNADKFQKKYIDRLERQVDTLVRGVDQPVAPNGLGLSGWEF